MADTIITLTSPDGATLNTAGTYCEGDIEVVPKLQSKVATTGEIVTADDGYVGLESVDTTPVFEAGEKSAYDAFWDAFQNYGKRNKYEYGFCSNVAVAGGWNDETFKPKYDLILSGGYSGTNMFWGCQVSDLVSAFERCGIVFNTSRCSYFSNMFQNAKTRRLGTIDMSNSTGGWEYVFSRSECETIEKLIVHENITPDHMFFETLNLVNLTIEGTIGQNGLNLSWSPLSKASLVSVVNALSESTTGLTVTLRLAAVNTAFETAVGAADGSTSEEWTALIATKPNWTINLINS